MPPKALNSQHPFGRWTSPIFICFPSNTHVRSDEESPRTNKNGLIAWFRLLLLWFSDIYMDRRGSEQQARAEILSLRRVFLWFKWPWLQTTSVELRPSRSKCKLASLSEKVRRRFPTLKKDMSSLNTAIILCQSLITMSMNVDNLPTWKITESILHEIMSSLDPAMGMQLS